MLPRSGRPLISLILTLVLVLGITWGCSPADNQVIVGSKADTEQKILGHLTVELLEAHGYDTVDRTGLGGTAAVREALETEAIDIYWEYTSTAWMAHLGNDEPLEHPERAHAVVAEEDREVNDIIWLPPAQFNSTYALLMRQKDARELGLQTISDLAALINQGRRPLGKWALGSHQQYHTRPEDLEGLQKTYEFEFDEVQTMELGTTYGAVKDREVPVAVGFATDGRVHGYNLIHLEDDRNHHHAYNAAPTVREEVLERHENLPHVLGQLSANLDTEAMSYLNAQVNLEGGDPQTVALDYLEEEGLLP